jgi:hypothetical protein
VKSIDENLCWINTAAYALQGGLLHIAAETALNANKMHSSGWN